ncbi:MAG: amidohydrolase family protein [Armatimonadetes bacterium]|nr:amidohydrolase family protein [Armatimonadota bacterium]
MPSTFPEIQAGCFACAADRLFDGVAVLENHAVIVEGRTVAGVMPSEAVPESLPLARVPGTTILPGLIDAHTHLMRWELPLFLAYGVTAVRDTGNDPDWILQCRAQDDEHPSPAILCVGPLLDGSQPFHKLVSRACRDRESAVDAVRETAAAGTDGIKLYVGIPKEWLPAMAEASHAAGLKVSIHSSGEGVRAAARAGIDEFHHLDGILADVWPGHPPGWLSVWSLPEFARTRDAQRKIADEIARLGMAATPTLAYWQSQCRLRDPAFSSSEEAPGVPPEMVLWQQKLSGNGVAADRWRRALEAAQRFTGLLFERGVPILVGTDTPCGAVTPGLSLWHEMALLAGSGMSSIDALQAATSKAADFLGISNRGRLASGSAADLVIIRGDPTREIPAEPDIIAVLKNGKAYQPTELRAKAAQDASTVTEDPWGIQFQVECGDL